MADSTAVIEMIKRIIADDTADLRERIQHLESRIDHEGVRAIGSIEQGVRDLTAAGHDAESVAQQTIGPAPGAMVSVDLMKELEARLDAIKAMHRLDATPVQWTRSNDGKMVEAPEGLWDIECLACNHKTVWREGDKKPPQCKTWRLADGQTVQ